MWTRGNPLVEEVFILAMKLDWSRRDGTVDVMV
jgi:hypothetical protein